VTFEGEPLELCHEPVDLGERPAGNALDDILHMVGKIMR
jgi:hypothetical protein